MAALVLGAVGGLIGGPIGFLVGSFLGNLLFPPKGQDGPRLTDLKLQVSSYGVMIPIVYGTIRLAGNVIWTTDLIEHRHSSGGKGGPRITTFTYTASFAVAICECEIQGIRRIWADSRLVYDTRPGSITGAFQFTLYKGSETQMPDPTMEAILGVGFVPGYRGITYVVFDDIDMSPYFNRIPSLTFEVVQHARAMGHIREVSANRSEPYTWGGTFAPPPINLRPAITQWSGPSAPTQIRVVEMGATNLQTYENPGTAPFDYIGPDTLQAGDAYPLRITTATQPAPPHDNFIYYSCGYHVLSGGGSVPIFCDPTLSIGTGTHYAGLAGYGVVLVGQDPVATLNVGELAGIPSAEFPSACSLSADGTQMYVFTAPSVAIGDIIDKWYKIVDLAVVDQGTVSPAIDYQQIGFGKATDNSSLLTTSCFENDAPFCWAYNPAGFAELHLFSIDPVTKIFAQDAVGGYLTSTPGPQGWGSTIGGGTVWCSTFSTEEGYCGLVGLDRVALYTRFPIGSTNDILLSDIVADISDRAGLSAGQYDVTRIPIPVHGYVISKQADARSGIATLQAPYFFDAVESDGKAKFVPRGSLPVVTIVDNDLAGQPSGGTPPAILEFKRGQETDLPRRVTTVYLDLDADYQDGSQVSQRIVTSSELETVVQLPIALHATEARQMGDRLLFNSWLERDSFTFYTSRQYAYLEPTDVIVAHGRKLRITDKDEERSLIIKWQGVQTIPQIAISTVTGDNGSGFNPAPPVPAQLSQLLLLDIPLVKDTDLPTGFYAAMAGAVSPSWPGAVLFKSSDGGINYNEIASTIDASTIGAAATVLGDFLGGNIFDELNSVTIVIGPGGGDLASESAVAVLNGANMALLGAEVIQYKTATLIAASTYTLSGLLRGRRGSDWAMTTHVVGDQFVVLQSTLNLIGVVSDLQRVRQFKGVTFGDIVALTTAQSFVDTGVVLAPYAPVYLGQGVNAAGDITLTWIRRTRIDGTWRDYIDVPLGEASEQYQVTLWADNTYRVAMNVSTVTAPSATFTVAQQTAIFGSPQSLLYWSVAQIGALGPGYDTLGRGPVYTTLPPPAPPPATGVPPIGVQWHAGFNYGATLTNARRNFNYLMNTYGSSWAFAYMIISPSALSTDLGAELGDAVEAGRIINTFCNQGNYGPEGMLIPFGERIDPGPTLHTYRPLVDIPLPYPDNDVV